MLYGYLLLLTFCFSSSSLNKAKDIDKAAPEKLTEAKKGEELIELLIKTWKNPKGKINLTSFTDFADILFKHNIDGTKKLSEILVKITKTLNAQEIFDVESSQILFISCVKLWSDQILDSLWIYGKVFSILESSDDPFIVEACAIIVKKMKELSKKGGSSTPDRRFLEKGLNYLWTKYQLVDDKPDPIHFLESFADSFISYEGLSDENHLKLVLAFVIALEHKQIVKVNTLDRLRQLLVGNMQVLLPSKHFDETYRLAIKLIEGLSDRPIPKHRKPAVIVEIPVVPPRRNKVKVESSFKTTKKRSCNCLPWLNFIQTGIFSLAELLVRLLARR
jgi:hypothetical protein